MPKIVQYNLPPGGTVTQIADNQVALEIESTDAKEYIEINTSDSAPTIVLGKDGAKVHVGAPSVSRTLSVGGELRVEADGTNDLFQVVNAASAGSAGILGISQGDINFTLKSSSAYFGVLNDSKTLFSVFQDGKITSNGEASPLCDAGGVHILGSAATSNGGLDPGARLLVLEDNGTGGAGMSIVSDTDDKCTINFCDTHRRGSIQYYHNTDHFRVQAGGVEDRLRLNAVGLSINSGSDPSVTFLAKGSLTGTFSGTVGTGGSSSTTLVRSGNTASEICDGAAIKIGSDVRTITQISANGLNLTLNSAVTVANGTSATTDPSPLRVLTGNDEVALEFTNKRQLVIADGNSTVVIGSATTGAAQTSTENNVIIGAAAAGLLTTGYQNTIIGRAAGDVMTTGTTCVIIGDGSDPSANSGTNQVIIGQGTTGTANNQVRVGNGSISSSHVQVDWTVDSDSRIKDNVQPSALGLDFVNALRPVSFTKIHPADWPDEIKEPRFLGDEPAARGEFDTNTVHHGLIAQELEAAIDASSEKFSGHNVEPNGRQGIQYATLVIPLIKAVQELTARIEELENGE